MTDLVLIDGTFFNPTKVIWVRDVPEHTTLDMNDIWPDISVGIYPPPRTTPAHVAIRCADVTYPVEVHGLTVEEVVALLTGVDADPTAAPPPNDAARLRELDKVEDILDHWGVEEYSVAASTQAVCIHRARLIGALLDDVRHGRPLSHDTARLLKMTLTEMGGTWADVGGGIEGLPS